MELSKHKWNYLIRKWNISLTSRLQIKNLLLQNISPLIRVFQKQEMESFILLQDLGYHNLNPIIRYLYFLKQCYIMLGIAPYVLFVTYYVLIISCYVLHVSTYVLLLMLLVRCCQMLIYYDENCQMFQKSWFLSLMQCDSQFLGARAPLGLLYVGLSVTNLLQNSKNLIELDIT